MKAPFATAVPIPYFSTRRKPSLLALSAFDWINFCPPPCRLIVYDDNFEKYRIKANAYVCNNHKDNSFFLKFVYNKYQAWFPTWFKHYQIAKFNEPLKNGSLM